MDIKLLSQDLVNQIAAGEVIERPASVIKELMENAIDAGADEITVKVIDAGKNFISVSDNGCGMDKDSIELCVLSHATSKLNSENLFDVHTFGFRGEALPSIAAISRFSITSTNNSSSEAWTIKLEGSNNLGLFPSNHKQGTTVEIRDLFFATPARLKFLKSDASELENCCYVFNRIAMAFPGITFRFMDGSKEKFHYNRAIDAEKRTQDILGESFVENTFRVDTQKGLLSLHGFIGVPTFNKTSTSCQYFFVNNRFVKDKIFTYAIKSAYASLIPPGRYAAAVLFLDMPYDQVDVNAHPAKIEVRFKNSENIRCFILSELKKSLSSFGGARSAINIDDSINRLKFLSNKSSQNGKVGHEVYFDNLNPKPIGNYATKNAESEFYEKNIVSPHKEITTTSKEEHDATNVIFLNSYEIDTNECHIKENCISLGNAIHQVGNTYIIAENGDNLIVVDQHAAAERIALEKIKNNLSLDSQTLLLPAICSLQEPQIELLENSKDLMLKFGIHYEKLSNDLIVVNSIPAILGNCDILPLMNDIIDELFAFGDTYSMNERIHRILSTISCHGSLRAGKKLTLQEMNYLLRQMEKTENIAQCCHGRPSYIMLSIKNLNIFFERS